MNWEKWVSAVFGNLVSFSVLFIFISWDKGISRLGVHGYIAGAMMFIASSIGTVGSEELRKTGHRKALRIWGACILIPFIAFFAVILTPNVSRSFRDDAIGYLMIPFWVLVAASFPLALYLNQKPNKSASKPSIVNAP